MKTNRSIFFLLAILTGPVVAQSRLPEITSTVVTDFAVYEPQLVTITPDAPACDPGAELEKVCNLNRVNLSNEAVALLKKNHFVVTPITAPAHLSNLSGYHELFDIYCENRDNNMPSFITSDAMLHSFHLCFDYVLKVCEEKRFIARLNLLLDAMLTETATLLAEAGSDTMRSALETNLNYFIVAKKLLDSAYVAPIASGPYVDELTLITNASSWVNSPIFNYEEDYSQYIVRGHYTRSVELQHYFRAMMWLGRMTFSCERFDNPASRAATRSALALVQAFQRSRVNGQPAMTVWDEIYQPTVFFVGKSDDVNFLNFLPLIEQTYGDDFPLQSVDQFLNESLLTRFLIKCETLPQAAIGYPGQPAKGFRFMGQRFIPDSYMLDQLVYPHVPGRFMPTGLDVMQVLGSERAFALLPDKDRSDPNYAQAMDSLKNKFIAYPAETWAQNIYWNWLYTLMPLLWNKGAGYPWFMQTEAWQDKDLNAALASWAELRHDTILYAKQSGTERGIPLSAMPAQGYVEPNPHFFGRLAALAEFMQQGLVNRGLLFDEFAPTLTMFYNTALQFKKIAEKELVQESLTSLDYAVINEFGKTMFDIVTFGKGGPEGPGYRAAESGLEPMPIIADVHTDANSNTVLEEGVGHPFAVYVICNIEGRPTLTRGAGFSYYEFIWPMNDRLTDEKWRKQLTSNNPSQPVAWNKSFTADLPVINPLPGFYTWNKPNAMPFIARFDSAKQTLQQGDSLRLFIHLDSSEESAVPSVQITGENGAWNVDRITPIPSSFMTSFQIVFGTHLLNAGLYYVTINIPMQGAALVYRTHFILAAQTGISAQVALVRGFDLSNYPNPFNGITAVCYDLPHVQQVCVEIYNVKGEKIKTLFQGKQNAGRYQLFWDATTDDLQPVGSGVYFVRLNGEDVHMVRSISYIK